MRDLAWIAVDWGTSNLRAWAMGPGNRVLAEARSDMGMGSLDKDGFEPALLDIVGDWIGTGPVQVVACGMVGSRQGWVEAGYRDTPCSPVAGPLAQAETLDPRLQVLVAPGLRQARPADVMRGEETQIAGFLAVEPGYDGVLCMPGTHSKWVQISAGEVVSFRTVMTGEIFAALSEHSVLKHSVGTGWDAAAFDDAVSETLSKPELLAQSLFGVRAEGIVQAPDPARARARLSGLLVGAELAATRPYWLGQELVVIGDERSHRTYLPALAAQGVDARLFDVDQATRAGLASVHALAKETVG